MFNTIFMFLQIFLTLIMSLYFFSMLRNQRSSKSGVESDSAKELEKLRRLRGIHLSTPLSEKTRPRELSDVIGQENSIRALKAALCSPNPQHILIYGPPGVGKTAAARAVFKEAVICTKTPFRAGAPFIELDATTLRFDERSIADPLIGSVHDPIYQGAGAYGPAGIPQPKPGAVTRAHGGILFLDEIGELHPSQMNKLLKVLEDRTVMLESSYYASGNKNIPPHIHEMFQKGLPADFRLIGATTRNPEEIPPALRSRCVEIFFSPLSGADMHIIAENAAQKSGFTVSPDALDLVCTYAQNGRDAVNLVQTAGSVVSLDDGLTILPEHIQWVAENGRYVPRYDKKVTNGATIGLVNGLAVSEGGTGVLIDVEASAIPAESGCGTLTVTGIVEQQQLDGRGQKLVRQSSARASIENMLTLLKKFYKIDPTAYHLHINLPGGTPIDGPSAGAAILTAVYSAIKGIPVPNRLAMTGEISIRGHILPVGGVSAKVSAAKAAGAKTVLIPKDNRHDAHKTDGITVVPIGTISELFDTVFENHHLDSLPHSPLPYPDTGVMSAQSS